MGFLNADFILVASKLVFTKVLWRFENVPQLKFKYFQGPKWMNEEEFQEFSRPSTQKFIGFQGFSRRVRTLRKLRQPDNQLFI